MSLSDLPAVVSVRQQRHPDNLLQGIKSTTTRGHAKNARD